ncbi:unnamed protein product [Closterium sp. Yama58-4]|nr:unnamed protein product [Closterium sp. Yama58-4]
MSGSASRHFRSAAGALRHCLRRPRAALSAPPPTPVTASAVLATRHPHEPSICSSMDPALPRTSASIGRGFSVGDASPGDTWHRSDSSFQHGLTQPFAVFPIAIAARAVSFSAFHSSSRVAAAAADVAASGASGEKAQPPASTLLPTSGAPVVSPLVTGTSPLSPASPTGRTVRAVLSGLKQGPKKVNLVAAMVRGMTPDDALMQMAVSTKRAAKTVAQAITAAKANAVHNHGLEEKRLIIAEAFVGKGRYLKRLNPHGRGRSGVKHRYRSRLTVVVREMSGPEEERVEQQRAAAANHRWLRRVQRKRGQIVPHKVVEQPGIAIGRLCEKCDGKCVVCDSYVRPCTLVRICDECNYGSYQGRCVICGGQGISDAYYCKECTQQEKDRDGCPKIINLGSARTDLFYERKKYGFKQRA